jgi:L-ribulose-5-phosphate 4-epimerase
MRVKEPGVHDLKALRNEMVRICREAYAERLFAGTSGNLSLLLEGTDEMLITPTSIRYDVMGDMDIVHMKLDGTVLEGTRAPSSEWRMHAVLYEKLDHVFSVFHTHSPYATAFAANRKDIPFILIEMGPFLGGKLPCARFEKPGTRELGLSAVEFLSAGSHACLLASHGVIAVGKSLAQSFIRAEYVEDAARIYHLALQAGEPVVLGG